MGEDSNCPDTGGHRVESYKAKVGTTNRIVRIPWLAAIMNENEKRDITCIEKQGVCGRCGAVTSKIIRIHVC